jgi:NTP pyrophosphatase (non-canonical NTP hydrolase)
MEEGRITTIKQAQEFLRYFAKRNGWDDSPNLDKFDHLHEELIEMSQHLRYKPGEERKRIVREKQEIFKDGIGDLFFGICRLANQLGIDIEEAFNMVKKEILSKYQGQGPENNIVRKLH